jgi:[protein-PII] uridylyltransferase
MSAWNARMLADLWRAVCDHIDSGGATTTIEEVRGDLLAAAADESERERMRVFLRSMPKRYLLATTPQEACFHSEIAIQAGGASGADGGDLVFGFIELGDSDGGLQIVVGCPDRPGLLSDFTAALAGHRFSVDAAQVYTRANEGEPTAAFDIFHVSHPNLGSDELLKVELERLRGSLEDLCAGRVSAEQLLGRRSQPPSWARVGPRIKTEIHVDNSASPTYTVVDIYTRDRPDLLHVIARTLHSEGLSIGLAKVNTEGARVADVFYVQTADGEKLAGEGRLSALSNTLRKVLRELD